MQVLHVPGNSLVLSQELCVLFESCVWSPTTSGQVVFPFTPHSVAFQKSHSQVLIECVFFAKQEVICSANACGTGPFCVMGTKYKASRTPGTPGSTVVPPHLPQPTVSSKGEALSWEGR